MYKKLLTLLDEWRHYPKYQLERHVDVIFGLYLHPIIEKFLNEEMIDIVIPEFPIPKALLIDSHINNDVVNADFCLFSKDLKNVVFVELKTDHRSERDSQNDYYDLLKEIRFNKVLEKLLEVVKASNIKYKYLPLLSTLNKIGVLDIQTELFREYKEKQRVFASKYLDNAVVIKKIIHCKILYILPQDLKQLRNVITFNEISKYPFIDDQFKQFLAKWSNPLKDDIIDFI